LQQRCIERVGLLDDLQMAAALYGDKLGAGNTGRVSPPSVIKAGILICEADRTSSEAAAVP